MSYEIKFRERYEDLKYLLRIRGTSSGIVDLCGNNIINHNCDYSSTPSILGNGTALNFNGTNSYIEYRIQEDLLKTDEFTISLHVRGVDTSISSQSFMYMGGNDGNTGWVTPKNQNSLTVPSFFLVSFLNSGTTTDNKILWANNYIYSGTWSQNQTLINFSNTKIQSYHLAAVHKNGITQVSFNGEFGSIAHTDNINILNKNCLLASGLHPFTQVTHKYAKFILDDICVIKGRALWTSSFKPPTKYLPDKWPVYD